MGKKDIREKAFMKIPANFADLCNGVLFEGEQVIKPDELEETGTEVLKKENSVFSDVAMRWKKNNTVISVIEIENQSRTDYAMVIRNLNLIISHYKEQLAQKWAEIEKLTNKGDTKPDRDEFLSEMMKDTLLTPVIAIVVYYNENPWKGKRRLSELLDLDGIPEKYRDYMLDYKMILFDYHDYDNYDFFTGEMKRLCEALCLQKDKYALERYFENKEIPSITAELLGAVINMNKEKIKKHTYINEEGEEVTDMCTALKELIEDGKKDERANTLKIINSLKTENNIKIHTPENGNGYDETDMCTALKELLEDGREEGRKEERVNTKRERERAEKAETELAEYIKRYGKL